MTTTPTDLEHLQSINAFADSARDLLQAESPLARIRSLRVAEPAFDRKLWRTLADAGWPAVLAPEDAGGLGLDLRHACAIAEQVGKHPLPEPVLAAAIHAVALLAALPAGDQRDRLLAACVAGDMIVGVAWQERAGQIEPEEALSTSAALTPQGFRLDGAKRWAMPGTGADGWLVSAAAGSQPGLWWVPHTTEGLQTSPETRVDGSSCAALTLKDAHVPAAFRLATGGEALAALRRAADFTRLAQAAELLGIARAAFDMTHAYVSTRVQFGKPIGSNQALQHRLVDCFIQIELAAACLQECLADENASPRQLAAAASRAKARCLHAALHVTREGVQMHGAIGFTDEYDLGLYLKRALAHAGWLGSLPAMRLRHHQQSMDSAGAQTAPGNDDMGADTEAQDLASLSEPALRSTVRRFLRDNYPEALRHPSQRLHWSECRDWYLTLSRKGWLAPAWPKAHGGMGLPADKLLAFIEEMEDWGVARLPDQGLINLGPVLIRFGTPQQQQEYLPKILSGEHIWCQGYSEPNAGSDLASLRTEALLDGDTFVVNGQKIWTTLAQDATHIFALVRTDKTGRKQEGISFLLIDLATPGVRVRPILNIAGEEEFCEVFFDNVRVPRRNLVGELHAGWNIAKALLGFERIFVGSPKTSQNALTLLRRVADARGLFESESFTARFAQLELDVADLKSAYGYFADLIKRGLELPPSVSILKVWASETYTSITRFMCEACEEDGAASGEFDLGGHKVNIMAPLMNATITTIYAGANEIQRNILAKAVLKLPA